MVGVAYLGPSPLQQGLSSPHLSSCDCVRLVAAIGGVLSTLPLSDLVGPLESLVASRVDRLQALAGEEPSPGVKVQVEKELDVLGALCHHIYPDLKEGERHPVVPLLSQLFPAVQLLITKWCMDHSVVEVSEGAGHWGVVEVSKGVWSRGVAIL